MSEQKHTPDADSAWLRVSCSAWTYGEGWDKHGCVVNLHGIADRIDAQRATIAELDGELRNTLRDLACVQLCLLQNDQRGALEITNNYGRIDFSNGPRFLRAAAAKAEGRT